MKVIKFRGMLDSQVVPMPHPSADVGHIGASGKIETFVCALHLTHHGTTGYMDLLEMYGTQPMGMYEMRTLQCPIRHTAAV